MSMTSHDYCDQLRSVRERLGRTKLNDPALAACVSALGRVEEVLRRPLRVVILGESNSGKTSVTDLLIGEGLLPTSVVSNTRLPVLIGYAETPALHGIDRNGKRIRIDSDKHDPRTDLSYRALQVALPLERLRDYQILDTPSMATPTTFVGDADIVIWCTVATRAWTESERLAWASLPKRCSRNALLVATHKDSLQTEEDCEQVTARLRHQTHGLFRDVVLVAAPSADGSSRENLDEDAIGTADALRDAVRGLADGILDRRVAKAEKIVRKLARLTFHEFGRHQIGPDAAVILSGWTSYTRGVVDKLASGRRSVPETIQDLLAAYALCAEKLRPGVVTGDSIPGALARALTTPVRWPAQTSAAARMVDILVSDLTGLLRMLAGHSAFIDPKTRSESQAARSILLLLADLDGAFDALSRMLQSPSVSQPA